MITLGADEFIRRFLLHVLPDSFRRIRHFGFLANAHRTAKLTTIRALLGMPAPARDAPPMDYRARYTLLTGRSLDICPCCGGVMVQIASIMRSPPPASRSWYDTS